MNDSADALDLPRFAAVMAHLRHFPATDRGEVLSRLGVDERAWAAAVASWYDARDAALARGATDLMRRFGAAFGDACRRLEADRPTLASLVPLAAASPPPPPPPTPEPPRIVSAPAAPIAPPALVAPPAPSLVSTLPLGTELPPARLPFVAPPPRALTETAPLPPGVADAARVPVGVPDLTLTQYASLRVELQVAPERAGAILARYGVPRDAQGRLDQYWRGRFEADPLLRMMFAKAYATYVGWLRGNRGG